MRHAAITFADHANQLVAEDRRWDIIFCSDMLNLAEFLGLVDKRLSPVKSLVYFHENQLTYPSRFESERDYQFVMTNVTTALSADSVWFNSAFHRDDFLSALPEFFKRMPDNHPSDVVEKIQNKSAVYPPGIKPFSPRSKRKPGPIRILWAARWEHDKNGRDFFDAIKQLKQQGLDFRLSVIGKQFREIPQVFTSAKKQFADHIDLWGYQQSQSQYRSALCQADIIVSTGNHEFFGISVIEAIAAGAYPLLPERLAYPEIVGYIPCDSPDEFLYDGTTGQLAERLIALAKACRQDKLWRGDSTRAWQAMRRFYWENLAPEMDNALEQI